MQKIWRRKKHILTIIDALLLNYHIYCLACNLSSCWVENKCWQKKIITGIAYCTKSVLTNNSGWVRIKDKFESQRVCLSTYYLLNMHLYITDYFLCSVCNLKWIHADADADYELTISRQAMLVPELLVGFDVGERRHRRLLVCVRTCLVGRIQRLVWKMEI